MTQRNWPKKNALFLQVVAENLEHTKAPGTKSLAQREESEQINPETKYNFSSRRIPNCTLIYLILVCR